MVTINREELKKDPDFNRFFELVIRNHKNADHTIKVLQANSQTKDFCEQSVHFAIAPPKVYISYQASSWLKDNRVLVVIDSITFYDDEGEYMVARMKGFKDLSGFVEKN